MAAFVLGLPAIGGATAKLLGWGTLMTGAGMGGAAVIGRNDDWAKPFGLDPASRVRNEEFDRTTGQIKDYSFSDFAGSLLLGHDLTKLNEAAQAKSDKEIIDQTRRQVKGLTEDFNSTGLDLDTSVLKLDPRETADEYKVRLAGQAARLEALDQARGIHGIDIASLTENGKLKGVGAINAAITKAQREDPLGTAQVTKRSEEREIQRIKDSRKDTEWNKDRTDRVDRNNLALQNFQNNMALYNAKTADDWKRFELSLRQADREQTRRDNKQQLLWQMEQRNLDRAYNRERDERADSRAKAQQRLALILKMIGGIG